MNAQNQTKRALSKPEAIEYVRLLLEEEDEFFTRTELADVVCEEFGFQDPRGQNQLGGCLKGLRELEAKGWFQLPRPEIQKMKDGNDFAMPCLAWVLSSCIYTTSGITGATICCWKRF